MFNFVFQILLKIHNHMRRVFQSCYKCPRANDENAPRYRKARDTFPVFTTSAHFSINPLYMLLGTLEEYNFEIYHRNFRFVQKDAAFTNFKHKYEFTWVRGRKCTRTLYSYGPHNRICTKRHRNVVASVRR